MEAQTSTSLTDFLSKTRWDHVGMDIPLNAGPQTLTGKFSLFNHQAEKRKCEEATKIAIDVGFRHIDGAYLYNTEEQIGRAVHEKIADGTVKRENIFYTGKVSEFDFFLKK